MLTDTRARTFEKRIALLVRHEPFRAVLAALLEEWGYTLLEAAAPCELILAEEGCPVPEGARAVLWLTRSRYQERDRVPLPLALEELWSTLESRFHKPPRNHIRLQLDHPVTVRSGDGVADARFTSLSDVGCRLEFHREAVMGERFALLTTISGRNLELAGRVIYVIPGGDEGGRERTQVGVLFEHLPREGKDLLRHFIVRSYLERVRDRLETDTLREGLTHFDLPLALLADLGYDAPDVA